MHAGMKLCAILLALVAFCSAQSVEHKDNYDSTKEVWLVIGVIASTTMCVLIILVPTMLYYKYKDAKDLTTINTIKK